MSNGLPEPALLTDIVEEVAARAEVAGAQVSVVSPQGRVDIAWGNSRPVRSLEVGDRIQVGSLAKVLTAVLIHQLADDGLLSLEDDVAEVAADAGDGQLAAIADVTVGQLLSMTSGLDWGIWAAGDTVAEALRPQLSLPRRAGAGSFGYSFASTMVAARLVELLRCTSWWDAVLARIALPLDLRFTDVPDSPGNAATETGWTLVEAGPLTGMGPTGTTLCASAADLATLALALADPGGPLLSPASHASLHEAVVDVGALMCADAWCHGPYSRRAGAKVLHGHGGRWAGGVSDLTWEAATGTAVAIVTNTPGRGGELVRELSRRIHPLIWGERAFVPTAAVDAGDPACSVAELDALTGRYATATRIFDVQRHEQRLIVHVSSRSHASAVFTLPDAHLELVAIGRRRFLPVHETREERRLQEFWFSREATPEYCYDGFVAARREGQSGTGPS